MINQEFYFSFLKTHYSTLGNKIWDFKNTEFTKRNIGLDFWSSWAWMTSIIVWILLLNWKDLIIKNDDDFENFFKEVITDWNSDNSFDAMILSESTFTVYDIKWWQQNIEMNEIERLSSNIERYLIKKERFTPTNPSLTSQIEKLDRELLNNFNKKINIVVYREKEIDDQIKIRAKQNLEQLKLKSNLIWDIFIIDKNDILKLITQNLAKISLNDNTNFNLKLSKVLNIDSNTIISVTNLKNLINFYLKCKDKGYDPFYMNVRDHLWEADKSKNLKNNIIDTINLNPKNFIQYHNWISITCNWINKESNNNFNIELPQIINGCQTINTVFIHFIWDIKLFNKCLNWKTTLSEDDIWKIQSAIMNIEKLKTAEILIKIHKIEWFSEEIKKISEYSNTQIPINKENLRSNDIEQLMIENFLSKNWFEYKRKEWWKSSFSSKKINFDEFLQLIHSCLHELPNYSKDKKQEIFTIDTNKNSYNNILSRIDFDNILLIAKLRYYYYEYVSKNKLSTYYEHFIITALFYLYNNNIINENSDFYNIINKLVELLSGLIHKKFKSKALQKEANKTREIFKIEFLKSFNN